MCRAKNVFKPRPNCLFFSHLLARNLGLAEASDSLRRTTRWGELSARGGRGAEGGKGKRPTGEGAELNKTHFHPRSGRGVRAAAANLAGEQISRFLRPERGDVMGTDFRNLVITDPLLETNSCQKRTAQIFPPSHLSCVLTSFSPSPHPPSPLPISSKSDCFSISTPSLTRTDKTDMRSWRVMKGKRRKDNYDKKLKKKENKALAPLLCREQSTIQNASLHFFPRKEGGGLCFEHKDGKSEQLSLVFPPSGFCQSRVAHSRRWGVSCLVF